MEYEDELERMRHRRSRQNTQKRNAQQQGEQWQRSDRRSQYGQESMRRNSSGQKRGRREPKLDIMEFDELQETDDFEPIMRQNARRRRNDQNQDFDRETYRENHIDTDRKKRRKRKKKHRFLVLKVLILAVILAGGYFFFQYRQSGTGFWTVAVFGVDSRNGNLESGALSDVEMLCVIDRKTGEIKLVSVYRDTYLEISPDGTYHKINEAYFKGGHEQGIEALERNLDLTIDDYATFNWKAVADAITILGGIDVEISESEFRYINGFITETVESTGLGSHHLEHAGMNHLDGVQAVAYARLRLMDTDYNRTARQRLVIQLAMNKAKEADLKTLTTLVQAVIPQLSTSIGADDILPMVRNITKYHIGENGGFPFSRGETNIGKKDCVIPLTLESNVIQLHQFLYGTENYQPSATVKRISEKIAADSGMGEVAENAPEAKVAGQKSLDSSGSSGGGDNGSGDQKGTQEANTEEATIVSQETSSEAVQGPEAEASLDESVTEEETTGEEISTESSSSDSESEGQSHSDHESQSSQQGGSNRQEEGPGAASGPGTGSGSGDGQNGPAFSDGPGGLSDGSGSQSSPNVYKEKPVIETTPVGPGV